MGRDSRVDRIWEIAPRRRGLREGGYICAEGAEGAVSRVDRISEIAPRRRGLREGGYICAEGADGAVSRGGADYLLVVLLR